MTKLPSNIEMLLLLALKNVEKPGIDGLQLMEKIEKSTPGDPFSPSLGQRYSALKRMRKKGWIDSVEGEEFYGGLKKHY